MKYLFLLGCFFLQLTIKAQNISQAEYFLDTDPGRGNGTSIAFSPGTNISLSIPLSSVTKGFHVFYIRVKDSLNVWSLTQSQPIFNDYISAQPNTISRVEYFLDSDPGAGNGNPISYTPGSDVSVNLPVNTVNKGFHVIYVRAKDANGNWSLIQSTPFYNDYISVLPNLKKAEYFFDTDPGFGNGTNISISNAANISQNFVADISGLSVGQHKFYVRAKDSLNHWSLMQNSSFTVCNSLNAPLISGNTNFFNGDTIKLYGSTVIGASSYLWNGPNSFSSGNLNIQINNATASMAGIYTLIAIKSGGTICDTSSPATITMNITPDSLSLSTDSIYAPFAGSIANVTISSNRSWNISSNQIWATINPASGSGNGNFAVTTIVNPGVERIATITATAGSITKYVYLVQHPNTTGLKAINYIEPITIFPNPTNGKFVLDFGQIRGNKSIQVFDLMGKEILDIQTENTDIEIDLAGNGKGMYFIKVLSKKRIFITKVLLE